jgi:osmotically-inducible protein OsmY
LNAKVKNELIAKGVDTAKVTIESTDAGMVTLKGSVPRADQKAQAEKLAKQVPGVTSVQNELTVAP